MDKIDPNQIIEAQLRYLHNRATTDCLSDAECRSLEALIRCRLLLERVQPSDGDSLPDLSSDDLKQLLNQNVGDK